MFTLAWRKVGRGFGYGVAFRVGWGYAAANEQAALRVLGSRTQWSRCAAPLRDRAGQDRSLLPETFIAEGAGCSATASGSPARGSASSSAASSAASICLTLWERRDRDARRLPAPQRVHRCRRRPRPLPCLCRKPTGEASFEFVLLPLIHTGETINRILGAITAIEPPFWLGAEPLAAPGDRRAEPALARRRPGVHDATRRRRSSAYARRRFRVLREALASGELGSAR